METKFYEFNFGLHIQLYINIYSSDLKNESIQFSLELLKVMIVALQQIN